jgi:hypothetical protein
MVLLSPILHGLKDSHTRRTESRGSGHGLAHDPSSLLGRISIVLGHPLTVGRSLLGARRARAQKA